MPVLTSVYVCRTCPRYRPTPAAVADGDGERLARKIRALVADETEAGDEAATRVLAVNCLGGCPRPCNIAVGGAGKARLRFGGLTLDHADIVATLLDLYKASDDGEIPAEDLPDRLRPYLTARSPALPRQARSERPSLKRPSPR